MIGQTASHYRILEKPGADGNGSSVFRARHGAGPQRGAEISSARFDEGPPDARPVFARSTRGGVGNLNITQGSRSVQEISEHDGQPFIAIERLERRTLKHLIEGKALKIERILDIGIQITDALEATHAKRITHRDIKPANIFVTKSGQTKVLDFGLAKLASGRLGAQESTGAHARESTVLNDNLTGPGTAMGTISYMSSKQARGEDIDARADLFSFGVVLYEMSTGKQAFEGTTSAVVFDAILNGTPKSPTQWNPEIPPQLENIINKALEKDRDLRYQTSVELRADLKRLKRDREAGGRHKVAPAR